MHFFFQNYAPFSTWTSSSVKQPTAKLLFLYVFKRLYHYLHSELRIGGKGTVEFQSVNSNLFGENSEANYGKALGSNDNTCLKDSVITSSAVLANFYIASDIDSSFTLNPQAKTVLLGDNVTLACKIGSLPRANITWLLNGEVVTLGAATQDESGELTPFLNPLPHTPILGSSNSAANKDMTSKNIDKLGYNFWIE